LSPLKKKIINSPDDQSIKGPSWSWSYGSWIYNYLCNQLSCCSKLRLVKWIIGHN
jgi:hypothetical protein